MKNIILMHFWKIFKKCSVIFYSQNERYSMYVTMFMENLDVGIFKKDI